MRDKINDFFYCVVIVAIGLAVGIGLLPNMLDV